MTVCVWSALQEQLQGQIGACKTGHFRHPVRSPSLSLLSMISVRRFQAVLGSTCDTYGDSRLVDAGLEQGLGSCCHGRGGKRYVLPVRGTC